MPFDGSGNYVPPGPPTFPAVSGTTISSTYFNSVINDIGTALSNCLTRDGQGKPAGNISWNNFNLTGLGNGAAGAPSLSFNNDATTGIYSVVAGNLSMAAGGVLRMGMDPNNVRIYGGLSINRAYITPSTAELQVQTDMMLGGAGSNTLHLNGYYNAGYKYTVAGLSAAIRHDSATGIIQFMTSINAGAANAASDIREVGSFSPDATFATIGHIRPGISLVMRDGQYFYTPYNAGVDTGLIRAGVQVDGAGQAINFFTANTSRGGFTAAGNLALAAGLTTATTLGVGTNATIGGTLGVTGNTTLTGSLSGSLIQAAIGSGAVSPLTGTSNLAALPSGSFVNNGGGGTVLGVTSSIPSGGNNTSSFHYSGVTQSVAIWYLYGNGTTSYTSDERTKTNIKPARSGYLEDLMGLKVIKFDRRAPEDIDLAKSDPRRMHKSSDSEPSEIGLIAQDVEKIFPSVVEYAIHDLDGSLYELDADGEPKLDDAGNPILSKKPKSKVLKAEIIYGPIMLAAFQELVMYTRGLETRIAELEGA